MRLAACEYQLNAFFIAFNILSAFFVLKSRQNMKFYFLGVNSGIRRVVPMGTLSASLMMSLLCFTI